MLYSKVTGSHTVSQPSSSKTSSSQGELVQYYLEEFQLQERLHLNESPLMSKLLKSVIRMSLNDIAFQKSSDLSNVPPRFEEYTCDGDNTTIQNTAALNDDGERHEVVCTKVNSTSSDLDEQRTLKCGKASVNLGTTGALELPTECMNPQSGVVQGSEDSTIIMKLPSG